MASPLDIPGIPNVSTNIKIPLWVYKWLALIPASGFIGIDHWAVGSKKTAIAKLFVNVGTLGSWYAYDIIQAWNAKRDDAKDIGKDGLKAPFGFFDGIGTKAGKSVFDSSPASDESSNTTFWECILGVALFITLYLFVRPFLRNDKDVLSYILFTIATISYYGAALLIAFTMYFYYSKLIPAKLGQVKAAQLVANPYASVSSRGSKSRIGSMLGSLGTTAAAQRGGDDIEMEGGAHAFDAMLETTKRAFEIPTVSKDHLYFGLILLILPLCGFAAYALTKNKNEYKKDEVSGKS
jgi:hypothetical protein